MKFTSIFSKNFEIFFRYLKYFPIAFTSSCCFLIKECDDLSSIHITLSSIFYIYKEESLSVCLFAMHSVPVIARDIKLSMALLWVQRKVDMGLAGQRDEGMGGIR